MQGSETPLVHIVGAGPGDPGLLTLRAHRLIGEAEVVVYDRLISPAILELVPAAATRIFVGKARGAHHLGQEQINALLVRLAREGRRVVRLKGGDPFVFGRGSEECLALAEAGIATEVVPGVTAGTGCAAAAGIPLTHRGLATGVRFITGQCRDDTAQEFEREGLADPDTTLVIYMGLAGLGRAVEKLVAGGLDPDTPAAAIAEGTTERQKTIYATLASLPDRVEDAGLVAPVTVIVGRVVALAPVLAAATRAEIPLTNGTDGMDRTDGADGDTDHDRAEA